MQHNKDSGEVLAETDTMEADLSSWQLKLGVREFREKECRLRWGPEPQPFRLRLSCSLGTDMSTSIRAISCVPNLQCLQFYSGFRDSQVDPWLQKPQIVFECIPEVEALCSLTGLQDLTVSIGSRLGVALVAERLTGLNRLQLEGRQLKDQWLGRLTNLRQLTELYIPDSARWCPTVVYDPYCGYDGYEEPYEDWTERPEILLKSEVSH
jgi:hypothetical protein